MKLEWKQRGELVSQALVFSWDDIIENMLVKHLDNELVALKSENNLVLHDHCSSQKEYPLPAPVVKGNLEDGTCRLVYPIVNEGEYRAGLTVHEAYGTWSSLPHQFEIDEIIVPRPMPFYEKFAYVTQPASGWGIQVRQGHLFDKDDMWWINDVLVIRDRDIAEIPLGNHPVSGGPGIVMAYIWVYWGNLPRREKF